MTLAPTTERPAGPAVRYHGAKWQLAEWIIGHFPPHGVYVEPYGGGGAVLLSKPRSRMEVYNDIDSQIVNVFRVLRDPRKAELLENLLVLTPYSREEFDLTYRPCRNRVEQARRTIVRGFLGRSNHGTSGQHRTGFRYNDHAGTCAQVVWSRYPDRIQAFCRRLSGVVIEHKPAMDVIDRIDGSRNGPQALYYCDPPYVHASRQAGAESQRAYRHEMSDGEHRELAERLHSVKGMVVISGYPTELYEELYGDWEYVEQRAYADGSKPRTERLWLSPSVSEWRASRLLI